MTAVDRLGPPGDNTMSTDLLPLPEEDAIGREYAFSGLAMYKYAEEQVAAERERIDAMLERHTKLSLGTIEYLDSMRKTAPLCMCKDRPLSECPGEWEPGCDLGNNEKHIIRETAP